MVQASDAVIPDLRRAAASAVALCLLGLALLATVPAPASAQGWTCEASALAATLGPSPRTEPITANKGEPACKAAAAGGNLPASPLPITGSLLSATTDLQPPTGSPSAQTATAAGGLGELRIAGLPIPLQRPDTSGLPGPQTIQGVGTIDVRAAVEALVPASFDAELLHLRALRAQVTGHCVNGAPQLTGTSSVLGISVLGKELPVDKAVSQTVSVVDCVEHRPVEPHAGAARAAGRRRSTRPCRPILDTLPTISIPATVGAAEGHAGPQDRGRRQAHAARARPHARPSAGRTSSTSRSARRPSAPRRSTAAASPTSRCSAPRGGSC